MKLRTLLIVVLVLLLAVLLPLAVAHADKPAQGAPNHPPRGGKHEGPDPCVGSECGNGDGGRGNPGNPGQGSEHASCNAQQGEVDPDCNDTTPVPPSTPKPTPTPVTPTPIVPPSTPVTPPPSTPAPPTPTPTGKLCCVVHSSICEVFTYDDWLKYAPPMLEDYVVHEDSASFCVDVPVGRYVVLFWMPMRGHEGQVEQVTIRTGNTVYVVESRGSNGSDRGTQRGDTPAGKSAR
jgi:hypothetical protein